MAYITHAIGISVYISAHSIFLLPVIVQSWVSLVLKVEPSLFMIHYSLDGLRRVREGIVTPLSLLNYAAVFHSCNITESLRV